MFKYVYQMHKVTIIKIELEYNPQATEYSGQGKQSRRTSVLSREVREETEYRDNQKEQQLERELTHSEHCNH